MKWKLSYRQVTTASAFKMTVTHLRLCVHGCVLAVCCWEWDCSWFYWNYHLNTAGMICYDVEQGTVISVNKSRIVYFNAVHTVSKMRPLISCILHLLSVCSLQIQIPLSRIYSTVEKVHSVRKCFVSLNIPHIEQIFSKYKYVKFITWSTRV
jgi:hypothetical protein